MNRSRARKLGLYATGTALTAASTLLTIPAVIAAAGAGAWANLLVGQSLGAFLAVVVGWGWSVTGPSTASAAEPGAVWPLFRVALVARSVLFVPVAAALAAAIGSVAPGDRVVAGAAALVAVVGALDAAWVLVGRARTGLLLLLCVVPRVTGTVSGAAAVATGAPLLVLPALQLAGACLAVLLSTAAVRRTFGSGQRWTAPLPEIRTGLGAQLHGTLTALLAGAYVALPILVVARLAPTGLPALGLADRLMRYAVFALGPVFGLAQAWVPAGGPSLVPRRAATAMRAAAVIALAGGAAYAAGSPLAGLLLTGDRVEVDPVIIGAYAVGTAAVLVTQVSGPAVLVALGAVRALSTSTVLGAGAGLVAIVGGTAVAGARGAAIAFALSEVLVLVVQVRAARRRLALMPETGLPPSSAAAAAG